MSERAGKHGPSHLISLSRARSRIARLARLGGEELSLADGLDRRLAHEVRAEADCPSRNVSLKDGFAVRSVDVAAAGPDTPVTLRVVGMVAAGDRARVSVGPGQAVRIMTGAPVPEGADAVLAAEFARDGRDRVEALADAHPGRNILAVGSDVARGDLLAQSGTVLTPALLGLLAAGGVRTIRVYRRPRVMVVATGSELVAPGEPITPGKVAASNMVTLVGELRAMGLAPDQLLIRDDLASLKKRLEPLIGMYDCVLTCGGVLDGDKDFTMQAMQELAIEPMFHRVRVGPGKGVCLGRSRSGQTLFCNLPGGPPSNHIAFVLLARPALERLGGRDNLFADAVAARLCSDLPGQKGWTQIFYGRLAARGSSNSVQPLTGMSRLAAMAGADCLIELAEEEEKACQGAIIETVWKIR